jgi:hypothetical protein
VVRKSKSICMCDVTQQSLCSQCFCPLFTVTLTTDFIMRGLSACSHNANIGLGRQAVMCVNKLNTRVRNTEGVIYIMSVNRYDVCVV